MTKDDVLVGYRLQLFAETAQTTFDDESLSIPLSPNPSSITAMGLPCCSSGSGEQCRFGLSHKAGQDGHGDLVRGLAQVVASSTSVWVSSTAGLWTLRLHVTLARDAIRTTVSGGGQAGFEQRSSATTTVAAVGHRNQLGPPRADPCAPAGAPRRGRGISRSTWPPWMRWMKTGCSRRQASRALVRPAGFSGPCR
jgi:hypothetical protein